MPDLVWQPTEGLRNGGTLRLSERVTERLRDGVMMMG